MFYKQLELTFLLIFFLRALQLLSSGLNLAIKQITDGNLKPSDNVKNGKQKAKAINKKIRSIDIYDTFFVSFDSSNNLDEFKV